MAEGPGGLAYGLGWVVGIADQNFLRGEHHLNGVTEALHVESADGRSVIVGGAEEGQQVEAGEIARRVIEVDVFRTRVAGGDPASVGGRVPAVDGGIELDAGVRTFPCRLGHLAKEVTRPNGLNHRTIGHGTQVPVPVGLHCSHELVGHADRVVGVLVHDRMAVDAIKADVKAGLFEGPDFSLLTGFAPYEFLDVGMSDV